MIAIFNGYKAGENGDSADPVKSHGLLKMAAQALRLESFTDTFLQGWHEGYRKGAETRQKR